MKGRLTGGRREKGLTLLLIYSYRRLWRVSGERKRPLSAQFQFFSNVFINPDTYIILRKFQEYYFYEANIVLPETFGDY